jgi:L-alanine-DL-glutamate epimerase-like enolase superfamily enzyme
MSRVTRSVIISLLALIASRISEDSNIREKDVFWLEEPTIPDDNEGHVEIARRGGLPIATGEILHTNHEFRHMLEFGRIAYAEPDVSNIGGVTNWMKVARLAHSNNVKVTSRGVRELHLHLLDGRP